MVTQKFKVGDKVKIVGRQTATAQSHQGHIGTIATVHDGCWTDPKYIEKCGSFWYSLNDGKDVWETDIELVESRGFITKDSGKRQEFDSGMNRDSQEGKPRYDLIIPEGSTHPMITRWAELLERGMTKYGYRNWEKARTPEELIRFKSSAFRHFMQWFMDESDEDHASAVFFNIQASEFLKEKMNGKSKA